jgi:hypothetical protein
MGNEVVLFSLMIVFFFHTGCRIKSLNEKRSPDDYFKSGFVCFFKTVISTKPTRAGDVKHRIKFEQP